MGLFNRRSDTTKFIGKVLVEQMKFEDDERWVLQRISPLCENCNKNNFYNITKNYNFNVDFKIVSWDRVYKIECPECGETIELEFEEFITLRPFTKINKKLEKGKISEVDHRNQNSKIMYKLRKTHL